MKIFNSSFTVFPPILRQVSNKLSNLVENLHLFFVSVSEIGFKAFNLKNRNIKDLTNTEQGASLALYLKSCGGKVGDLDLSKRNAPFQTRYAKIIASTLTPKNINTWGALSRELTLPEIQLVQCYIDNNIELLEDNLLVDLLEVLKRDKTEGVRDRLIEALSQKQQKTPIQDAVKFFLESLKEGTFSGDSNSLGEFQEIIKFILEGDVSDLSTKDDLKEDQKKFYQDFLTFLCSSQNRPKEFDSLYLTYILKKWSEEEISSLQFPNLKPSLKCEDVLSQLLDSNKVELLNKIMQSADGASIDKLVDQLDRDKHSDLITSWTSDPHVFNLWTSASVVENRLAEKTLEKLQTLGVAIKGS